MPVFRVILNQIKFYLISYSFNMKNRIKPCLFVYHVNLYVCILKLFGTLKIFKLKDRGASFPCDFEPN